MFKVFKLAGGMPNMATKSDALVMVEQAGYDAESIQETKKEIKTMKKEFSVVRQEVNASVVCANDSLTLLEQFYSLSKSHSLLRGPCGEDTDLVNSLARPVHIASRGRGASA